MLQAWILNSCLQQLRMDRQFGVLGRTDVPQVYCCKHELRFMLTTIVLKNNYIMELVCKASEHTLFRCLILCTKYADSTAVSVLRNSTLHACAECYRTGNVLNLSTFPGTHYLCIGILRSETSSLLKIQYNYWSPAYGRGISSSRRSTTCLWWIVY